MRDEGVDPGSPANTPILQHSNAPTPAPVSNSMFRGQAHLPFNRRFHGTTDQPEAGTRKRREPRARLRGCEASLECGTCVPLSVHALLEAAEQSRIRIAEKNVQQASVGV